MSADLEGDLDIGGDSAYDGGSLILMGHIFIGSAITSESKSPTSDDVDVGSPDFCADDLFFRDDLRDKIEADVLYDEVDTIHNTVALTTYHEGTTPAYESPPLLPARKSIF